MNTAALVRPSKTPHYYWPDGKPCFEVIGSTTKRPRPVTIKDARELGLFVSPTTVIDSVLEKPELEYWRQEQACLAVLTAPRNPGEELDAFVKRVLWDERQQEQEAKQASKLGSDIHAAMVALSRGEQVHEAIQPYVHAAWMHVKDHIVSRISATEQVVVGDGYAGTLDIFGHSYTPGFYVVVDYKSTRRLPEKGSYFGHRVQLAAYARAMVHSNICTMDQIITSNVYLSTTDPGKFIAHINPMWQLDYSSGFLPLYTIWCHMNNHYPHQIKTK